MSRGKLDMIGRVKAYCDIQTEPKRILVVSASHGAAVNNMREFRLRANNPLLNASRMEVLYRGCTIRFAQVGDERDTERFRGTHIGMLEHDGISEAAHSQLLPLVRQ